MSIIRADLEWITSTMVPVGVAVVPPRKSSYDEQVEPHFKFVRRKITTVSIMTDTAAQRLVYSRVKLMILNFSGERVVTHESDEDANDGSE
jgi:hypothetical protein